jgi:hypothetical protein
MRGWPEPVDLPLLLSQTRYNRSLAPDQAHVNNARYDIGAKFCSYPDGNHTLVLVSLSDSSICFQHRISYQIFQVSFISPHQEFK